LQIHDFLLERILHDETVNADLAGLTDSMSTIYCLQVLHWVPVMLREDNCICPCQGKSQASNSCG
jgi:hypothetical protein